MSKGPMYRFVYYDGEGRVDWDALRRDAIEANSKPIRRVKVRDLTRTAAILTALDLVWRVFFGEPSTELWHFTAGKCIGTAILLVCAYLNSERHR